MNDSPNRALQYLLPFRQGRYVECSMFYFLAESFYISIRNPIPQTVQRIPDVDPDFRGGCTSNCLGVSSPESHGNILNVRPTMGNSVFYGGGGAQMMRPSLKLKPQTLNPRPYNLQEQSLRLLEDTPSMRTEQAMNLHMSSPLHAKAL